MKIKKALIIVLIYLIGIGCVFVMCSRAEQINNQRETNNVSYKVNK